MPSMAKAGNEVERIKGPGVPLKGMVRGWTMDAIRVKGRVKETTKERGGEIRPAGGHKLRLQRRSVVPRGAEGGQDHAARRPARNAFHRISYSPWISVQRAVC